MSCVPIAHSAFLANAGRLLAFECAMQRRIQSAAQRVTDLEVHFKRRASVDPYKGGSK